MRRLILAMAMSLDGFAAGPGGVMDWHAPPDGPDSGDRRQRGYVELAAQCGLIVLGAGGGREMATAWPGSESPMGVLMNTLPKLVFSSTVDELEWSNTTATRGAIEDEIPALKREPGKDIVCFGGASFARALAAAGLIDEYRLTVHPVVLGEGVPLLHGLPEPQRLRFVGSTAYGDGVAIHEYAAP
ncbi:MAG: dihydrofolate reductase family protein [Solirubrobacteraceae bacterium]